MKIKKVIIHNFRSIKDGEFEIENYGVLIGENNAGKSNIISALRIFYEDVGLKYEEEKDFPKFMTDDTESFVEIHFLTSAEEQELLKEEYKSINSVLRVRKYFKSSDKALVQTNQSNIYAYENGILSKNLFYGAKNVSQAKLGKIIYIPEISKTEDNLKLTGPSPFRDMLTFVMKKVVKNSESFSKLEEMFSNFNNEFKEEATKDGFSLQKLVNDINGEIKNWDIKFGIDINSIKPEDIVKNLVSHHIIDNLLDGQRVSLNSYGQGLQRHVIYTLIKLSSSYIERKEVKKSEFMPDFTLILFEEPEAFLHPSQQEYLNNNLMKLAKENEQQIIITTHSPIFVSKNICDINSLIRIKKIKATSSVYQVKIEDINSLFDENLGILKKFDSIYNSPDTSKEIKKKIDDKKLKKDLAEYDMLLEEESIKYFMWIDSERASTFFAKNVIICEGASEKILFDYLSNNEWEDLKEKHVYFLDALGKFNIHRYMNLFGKLGIKHSIIMDKDNDKDIHKIINDFIIENKNSYTNKIDSFETDLETFLEISKPCKRKDLKPLNILSNLRSNQIKNENIAELRKIIDNLL